MFWWIIATLCAFFVKGLCGFANTLVFTTILSFFHNNVNISPIELILGYPTNLILAWKERKSIKWKLCLPLAGLVILGSVPGALCLKNADTGIVKMLFGVVIIVLGAEMLLREKQSEGGKYSKTVMWLVGILSGVLCGLYGVGALLGAYIGRVAKDSASFKANICVVFLAENTLRIILYTVWGILDREIIGQVLVLFPVMLIGLALGMLSSKMLNERIVKRAVMVMLIVSGAALIMNHIME